MKPLLATGITLLVAAVSVLLFGPSDTVGPAYALGPVAETLARTTGLHLAGTVRSRPGEPFDFVALDSPLQKQEIWIEAGPHGPARFRLETEDRVIAFDGEKTVSWNRRTNEYAEFAGGGAPEQLLDPERWIRALADRDAGEVEVETRELAGGRETQATVREKGLPVEGRAPAFWNEFDRRTEIRWEKATNRLLDLRRFVETGPRDLLVAEIGRVEYFDRMEDGRFRLELPAGAGKFEVVEAGSEFSRLGPQEVAREFWGAAVAGDWDRLRIFCPSPALIERFKEDRPAEVLTIGEPFQTGGYPGWYVPYAVRFQDGRTLRHNLALRNDNAFGRFVYDGGI